MRRYWPIMAKRRSKSSRAGKPLSERWAQLRPALVAGAWATTLIGAALALGMGVPMLRADALARRPEGPLSVTFSERPVWMTDGEIGPIADLVAEQLKGSPMDRTGLERAREALASTGWFEEIRQIRRSGSGQITVEGEWAVPFAVVREGGYDHLIDARGRLLPRCYRPGTAPRGLLHIEGAHQARPQAYGTPWPGDDMSAALSLARCIADSPWRSQIAWIDISDTPQDACLRMKTTRGCTVKWGRAPGREGAAEVPAKQKLEYLGWLHDHSGRIDAACDDQLDLLTDYVTAR
jgi:hypothetical protein